MGKGSKHKGNKNVFKVAGARSLKAKNKAKAVTIQLKKLSDVTKKKTLEVDKLLSELQDTVRNTQPQKPENKSSNSSVKDSRQDNIEKFEKTEERSLQTLEKLQKMEV